MSALSAAQAAKIARCPVLVLSTNRFTSQLVRSLFFGLGMQDVTVAAEPEQALEHLQIGRIDLMVADSGPATVDPFGTLAALRLLGDQRQARAPILLLTTPGFTLPEAAIAALDNIHRIPKPLSSGQLSKAVLKFVFNIEDEPKSALAVRQAALRVTTLLLSGNPYTAQVIRALLLTLGLSDLAVAGTADDAEHKLTDGSFDLVIADSGPASFDGLAAVEAARSRAGTALADTPVLLLAASPSASLVDRAKALEVKAIATKPLDPGVFAERVRKILSLR